MPFNVYASWPLGGELLYAAALAIGPHPTAKLVHFGCGLLVLYALVAALRGRGLLAGATAGALWIANPVVGFELRVAYVDLMTAFAFLAGGLFLARAATDEDERSPHLLLAGVAAGVAVATKVTGVLAAAVLLALHGPRLVAAVRAGRGRAAVRAVALRFGMPVVAAGVPWLVKAGVETGNPVYPFLHGLFGGAHWSDDLTARLAAWQRSIGMGREPLDYLLLPLRVFVAGGEGYARFDGRLGAFWVVLVPLALLLGLRLPPVRRALAAAGLHFAAWAATAQQMRFLIPAVPFLALAVAETAAERLGRLASPRARAAARVALFLAAAGLVVATNGPVLAAGWRVLPVLLRGDPAALLASAVPEVWRFVDAELAPDAKLLLLGTNRVFDCRREAIADSFFEASQIVDWLSDAAGPEEVARRLAAEGVTHVLVERRPGPSYPSPLLRLLDDPARAAAVFRSADDRHLVFALRSPAAEEGR